MNSRMYIKTLKKMRRWYLRRLRRDGVPYFIRHRCARATFPELYQ